MKKFLLTLLLASVLLLPANAAGMINSEYEARAKLTKINQLANKDFSSLVNKTDMIGERGKNFQITTMQYSQMTKATAEAIQSRINEIQIIRNSANYSDSEKNALIQKIYLDIETNIYNIDSHTSIYLINLRRFMPSITYQKFNKNFTDYYNSLNLTGNQMNTF